MTSLASDAAPALRLRPDFRPAGVLCRTGNALLIVGDCDDGPVVVKLLTDHRPPWERKSVAEIGVYRAFARTAPPVRVPRLVAADERGHVLIIERVPGRHPVRDRDRHPTHAIHSDDVEAMLRAVTDLAAWNPPDPTFAPVSDVAERIVRYRRAGLVEDDDHQALLRLLTRTEDARQIAHGDPLPTNFLLADDGTPTMLDWEFIGRYPPGYDLAVLWVLLWATPGARDRIEGLMLDEPAPIRAAFALNRAVVLLRELRSHLRVPPSAWRDQRLAVIRRDWQNVRDRLRER